MTKVPNMKGEMKMKIESQSNKRLMTALCATLIVLAVFVSINAVHAAASVWTDRADYSPEMTVLISGSGFTPNVSVTIAVQRPDDTIGTVTVQSDDSGAFADAEYKLDGIMGTYIVTATDGATPPNTATTTFTDTNTETILDPIDSTLIAGHVYTFSGLVREDNSQKPVPPGGVVDLHYKQNCAAGGGGGVGIPIAGSSATVDDGTFSGPFTAPDAGTWYFWAKYKGTQSYGDSASECQMITVTGVVFPPVPDISVEKTAPSKVASGGTVSISADVTNTGEDTLNGISVTDSPSGVVLTCPYTSLLAGDSMTCTGSYTAPTTEISETVTDTVTATGTGAISETPVTDTSSASTTVYGPPSIDVSKSIDKTKVESGGTVTVTATVTNDGPIAESFTISDDPAVSFTCTLIASGGTLNPSDSTTCTGTYSPTSTGHDTVTDTVTVTATDQFGRTATKSDSKSVDVYGLPSITVTKTAPQAVQAGDPVSITATVTNNGPIAASGVSVTDDKAGALTCPATSLAPGESTTCTATYKMPLTQLPGTCVTDTVTATATDQFGRGARATASAKTCVPGSEVTDSSLCPLKSNQFVLVYVMDPTAVGGGYKMVASNPGQFYDNVFYYGTPGSTFTLSIQIPYPFVTQGAVPIQVASAVSLPSGCYVPSGLVTGLSISAPGPLSPSKAPTIVLGNYGTSPVIGTTTVTVTVKGSFPSTGLVYVFMHLDYGLKQTTNWMKQTSPLNAAKSTVLITDPQSYAFSADVVPGQKVASTNSFKKDPGIAGVVTDSNGNPLSNVQVLILDSRGVKTLATLTTDGQGFYSWQYKYTGSPTMFTIKVGPPINVIKSVAMKSNNFIVVNFYGSASIQVLSK